MKISTMTRQQAMEVMGSAATERETDAFIALLKKSTYEDTADIPDGAWMGMMQRAIVVGAGPTPGPWTYESGMVWSADGRQLLQAVRELDTGIRVPAERDANVRAASAVPELMDACRLLVEAYHRGEEKGGYIEWDEIDTAFEHARAALAKAEGRGE